MRDESSDPLAMAQELLDTELTVAKWPASLATSRPLCGGEMVVCVCVYERERERERDLADVQYLTVVSLDEVITRPRPLATSLIFN